MGTKQDYEFEVKRSTLVKLYGLLGFKTADKWDCKKFEKKVKSLPDFIRQEGIEFQNKKAQKFVDGILKALDEGKTIVVVDESREVDEPEPETQETETEKETKVAKKKTKKTKTVKAKEKVVKKVSAKKKTEAAKPKKVAKTNGTGVIATIVECLKNGPVTKEGVVKVLAKKFPDRDLDRMRGTVVRAVSASYLATRGLKIERDENGYRVR